MSMSQPPIRCLSPPLIACATPSARSRTTLSRHRLTRRRRLLVNSMRLMGEDHEGNDLVTRLTFTVEEGERNVKLPEPPMKQPIWQPSDYTTMADTIAQTLRTTDVQTGYLDVNHIAIVYC